MLLKLSIVSISLLSILSATPSLGQEFPNYRNIPKMVGMRGEGATVQSSIVLSIPTGDTDQIEQQEQILKSFYTMAGRSCELVLQTLADECEITSVNTNVRADPNRPVPGMEGRSSERLSLNGNVTMAVKFKRSQMEGKP